MRFLTRIWIFAINFSSCFFVSYVKCSLDTTKQQNLATAKCESACFQGTCANGTCNCSPGWTGVLCETCAGRITKYDSSGFIFDGPSNYTSSMKCVWFLDGSQLNATSVTLRLDQFSTECCWDHVYIFDGDGMYSKQLAALSGTYAQSSSTGAVREFVAHSGQVYVFFYSDLAYNMSGFNISYKFSYCPKDCSGRGTCNTSTGKCTCRDGWIGEACDYPSCSVHCVNGKCSTDQRTCVCNNGFRGQFCNISNGDAVWMELNIHGPGVGRASFSSALIEHDFYIFYGHSFASSNFSNIAKLDLTTNVWEEISPTLTHEFNVTPSQRYDHSVVRYKDKIYMFGGVVDYKNITCELWSFDLNNFTWKLMTPDHHSHLLKPYHVAGHTAHVVNGVMIVLFGYNQYRGYLYNVQEYHISSRTWNLTETVGAHPVGTYGHSSVYDERSGFIYAYGGYSSTSMSTTVLHDKLYQYQPSNRKWSILRSSGYQTFLHSTVLLNNMLIVVGGNAHNESTSSKITKCYSDVILIYDIDCATWNVLQFPTYLRNGLARYGHEAFAYDGNMYIYGGFNGDMLDDVIKYIPGNCSFYRERDACVNSVQGSKCVWQKGRCLGIGDLHAKIDANQYEKVCPNTNVGSTLPCAEYTDCASCTSTGSQHCAWCNDRCVAECPEDQQISGQWPVCSATPVNCSTFHSCIACKLNEKCTWVTRKDQQQQMYCTDVSASVADKGSENNVKDAIKERGVCMKPCAVFRSCRECATKQGCLWCSTYERCIDTNAYVTSFAYGQCTQWTNLSEQCSSTEQCDVHLTCDACRNSGPRCGWCDDGSRTGLGKCLEGGAKGAVEYDHMTQRYSTSLDMCPSEHWYFFNCPSCQCNGHATCINDSTELPEHGERPSACHNCTGETTGDQCEFCVEGFFGNPLNGGNCSLCECNNQATTCDKFSGKCFCTTKGVSGNTCDKCDQKYIGDPKNQSCFYELTVDFVFTFNLNSEDDRYITKINFVSKPPKENTDVTFKLTCTGNKGDVGKVNLSIYSFSAEKPRKFLTGTACHEIERRFSAEEFPFGSETNTTFFVYLYDFKTPTIIQISFAQSATIDWMKFFVTFALCFFILLVLAFALWKIKQRVDLYRRRQRMFVEMAQMASRPFGSIQLDMTGSGVHQKWASAVAVEPCANYRAAVVTVALRLPTGGRKFAPNGQSGLAVASALCHITPSQLAQLQTPPSPVPEEKSKRRRPACIS